MSNLLQKAENAMSKYLDDALSAIKTIVAGNATDPKVTAAITSLQTSLASDEAEEAEVKQVVQALVNQLAQAPANATPPDVTTSPLPGTTDGSAS